MIRSTTLGLLALAATAAAQAIPVQVSFQATGIGVAAGPVVPVPQSTVSGTILYDAATTTSNINSLTSISMTIAGHVYTLGELSFNSATTTQAIGGAASGVNGLGTGPDFMLTWDKASLTPGSFLYTTAAGITVFSGALTQFSVSAIPEPSTWLMMCVGLGAVGFLGQRRRR